MSVSVREAKYNKTTTTMHYKILLWCKNNNNNSKNNDQIGEALKFICKIKKKETKENILKINVMYFKQQQ